MAIEGDEGALGPQVGAGISFDEFWSIGTPSMNDQGQAAFSGKLKGAGITDFNKFGLWRNNGGVNAPFARSGDAGALGPNLGGGQQYSNFFESGGPSLNSGGATAFTATMASGIGGVTPNDSYGLWRNAGGLNTIVARSGTSGAVGPGLSAGVTFLTVTSSVGINSTGDLSFQGQLAGSGPNNNLGIWVNRGGANVPLARNGTAGALGPGLGGSDFYRGVWPVDQ